VCFLLFCCLLLIFLLSWYCLKKLAHKFRFKLQTLHLTYRYSENLELEDAVHTSILALKESFEGQMTEDNIEIGICNKTGFRRLEPSEIKDYLASVS
jgi:hypothetical protein